MKAGWPVKRLGDLSDLITKGTTPTSVGYAFVPDGINFVKIESITENCQFLRNKMAHITQECHDVLKRSQLKPGDILFSIAGALGRTALVTKDIVPANINQALAIIRLKPSNDVLPAFVLQALATGFVLEQIENSKGGVAQQNLSLAQVQEFQIPLPPLPEQQRIVTILDEAFEGIATAKANAEKNLQNARALFESHLQSVFTQRGEGWEENLLSEFCEIKHGYAFDGADFSSAVSAGNPLVITPGNFTEDCKLLFNNKNTKRFNKEIPSDYLFNRGDLVVVMTDLSSKMKILGKPAIVEADNVLHNQRIGRVIFFNDSVVKRFVYYFMMSEEFQKNIKMSATGTMVKHTAPKRILSNVITFPHEKKMQQDIISTLDDLNIETQRLESIYLQKLAALDALKKSLLDQAFTGQL
jgi:type I restriction enzyme, S subunit